MCQNYVRKTWSSGHDKKHFKRNARVPETNEKIELFSKEIGLTKQQTEILELKNALVEIKAW